MKVVQINNTDLPGARFNGYNLMTKGLPGDVEMKQLVLDKYSDNHDVISFKDSVEKAQLYFAYEKSYSIRNIVIPYGQKICRMKEFVEADIIHYHLIHNGILSLFDLPKLLAMKKSVWTIHDPWIFTGHCVHPIECSKYLTGCIDCDHLERIFSMKKDNAHWMWEIKKRVFQSVNCDIVVASSWMLDLIRSSPLTRHWNKLHLIPFGVDLNLYSPDKRKTAREKFNIDETDIVLFFRADRGEYKGLNYIKSMLQGINETQNVILMAVGEKGLLNELGARYKVFDFGWLHDEKELAEIYAAADIFLMPSTAEAFGVMAIEAMASGLPVIVMDGTALPRVVDAPNCGLSFPCGDVSEFMRLTLELLSDKEKRIAIGKKCRNLAERKYDEQEYFAKMLDLYREILARP